MSKTLYDLLGVPPASSPEDIKKAFRKMALLHHPDRNRSDASADLFKKITEAYKLLTDPEKRFAYDAQIREKSSAAKSSPTTSKRRVPNSQNSSMGRNLVYHLNVCLEDIIKGTEKTISYMRTLHGKRVHAQVQLSILPGTADGQKLRLRGAGDSGSLQQKPGDLLVHIHYIEHPHFKVLDNDIVITVPISVTQWLLQEPLVVPTLYGMKKIPFPQPDDFGELTAQLPQYGLPIKGNINNKGDLFIKIKVQSPDSIDDSTRKEIVKLSKIWPKTKDELMFEEFLNDTKKST